MRETDTFVVHIVSHENSTWQGQITWANENQKLNFRSMLEMIKLMDMVIERREQPG